MAHFHHDTFSSLNQLNKRINDLLVDLNNRQMKKHLGSRLSQFNAIDKSTVQSLPQNSYKFTKVSRVKGHIYYHVEVNKHYYPVNYTFIKQKLEVHVTRELLQ